MKKLTFELEFITPAFIGGADPKDAELRPASFVGLLRWWYRKILQARVENLEELYKEESKLFGNQESSSNFWLKIKNPISRTSKTAEIRLKKIPIEQGISYLGYGNILYINFEKEKNMKKYEHVYNTLKKHGKTKLKGLFPAREFLLNEDIKDKTALEIVCKDELYNLIEALMFIFSQFGSLGGRSRRGWGSLHLIPTYESSYRNFGCFDLDFTEIRRAIKTVLGISGESYNNFNIFDIYVVKRGDKPLELLNTIGRMFSEFRNRREPDYSNVKLFLQQDKSLEQEIEVKRLYFGMPLKFTYKSLKGKSITFTPPTGRFASPVRFKVVRLEDGKYSVIIIHDKKCFVPNGINAELDENQGENEKEKISLKIKPLEDNIFYEFIHFLKKEKGLIEKEVHL
ncbi:type III-B CRISPR module RAMP protein Cmr1 [Hydrogenobacter thermophilus]|uniref:type III-B CRISPR module RAMP protein Cmr1 n=1 Tax=Hydrogenobacter thermophilus TaxID=940 RepID=UPI0030F9015D